MKLKDHVLKENRVLKVHRNGKRYVCRILKRGSRNYRLIATHYGCSSPFYVDFTEKFYLTRSRKWIMGRYQPMEELFENKRWLGFSTFEEVICWLKQKGFKILPRIHKPLKLR